jgi:hypothetical protein
MKHVILVTGRQGSGKTTFCESKDCYVLPGREARRTFGESFFASKENPSCPSDSEGFIRQIVANAIHDAPKDAIIHVDGFPRNVGQAKWIKELSRTNGFTLQIIIFHCDKNVRMERLINRDMDDSNKMLLVEAREKSEGDALFGMFCDIMNLGIPYSIIDTTDRMTPPSVAYNKMDSITHHTTIQEMFTKHRELLDIGGCKFPAEEYTSDPVVAGTPRANQIRAMFKHVAMECEEALELIPDKCWPIPDLTTDIGKLRVELIDAMHFVLSAAMSLNMSAQDFFEVYDRKRKINIERQTKGYVKTRSTENDSTIGKV